MKNTLRFKYIVVFLLALFVFIQASVYAQPVKQWDKSIGSGDTDDLDKVLQTSDGGYLLYGFSMGGIGFDKTEGTVGYFDFWIVKLSPDGTKQWDQTINTEGDQIMGDIIQAADGGYMIATISTEKAGWDQTSDSKGSSDFWIIKLSADGTKLWDKNIGGSGSDIGYVIRKTSDGGFILGGQSESFVSGDKSENPKGNSDYWIVKISSTGVKEWDKTIGGTGNDVILSMQPTKDNGYIIGGTSYSPKGADKSEDDFGNGDYWVVKLASNGLVQWDRTFGSEREESFSSIIESSEGGYIMSGTTNFSAPYVSEESYVNYDSWVIKIDANGTKQWERILGGGDSKQNLDVLNDIKQDSGGNYILGGMTNSSLGRDVSESREGDNYWLVKLNKDGTKVWDKLFGGIGENYFSSFQLTTDGGYILGGISYAKAGLDKTENPKGGSGGDYWIVKLTPERPVQPETKIRINAGGPEFVTETKKKFSADLYYAGIDRTSSISSGDILNTTNDVLYRSVRCSPSFSYNIPVANGKVDVILHFAETYFGAPGKKGGAGSRRFHVNIEGNRILTNYDIFVAAGGAMRPAAYTTSIEVTDGILNIDFLTGAADLPRISAIEVLRANYAVKPVADAYVRDGSYNRINYGDVTMLDIKNNTSDISARRSSYLKFQLPADMAISSAKLRIYGHNHENSSNISVHAYGVNNDSWTENGIIKVNAPAASTASLGYVAVNNIYKYYEIDVTSYVKSQQQSGDLAVSLLLNDPNNRNTRLVFNSKENAANSPQLVIVPGTVSNSNIREGAAEIIAEKEDIEVNIFPNPAVEILNIKMEDWHKVKSLELLNNRSDVVYHSGKNPVQSVNIKELPQGIYFVRIGMVDGSKSVRKVLIGR